MKVVFVVMCKQKCDGDEYIYSIFDDELKAHWFIAECEREDDDYYSIQRWQLQ